MQSGGLSARLLVPVAPGARVGVCLCVFFVIVRGWGLAFGPVM